jgi:hypothetical protein
MIQRATLIIALLCARARASWQCMLWPQWYLMRVEAWWCSCIHCRGPSAGLAAPQLLATDRNQHQICCCCLLLLLPPYHIQDYEDDAAASSAAAAPPQQQQQPLGGAAAPGNNLQEQAQQAQMPDLAAALAAALAAVAGVWAACVCERERQGQLGVAR